MEHMLVSACCTLLILQGWELFGLTSRGLGSGTFPPLKFGGGIQSC